MSKITVEMTEEELAIIVSVFGDSNTGDAIISVREAGIAGSIDKKLSERIVTKLEEGDELDYGIYSRMKECLKKGAE